MKPLVLLLLLANLFYAGWQLWIVPSAAPPAFIEADGVPRLELADDNARLASATSPADATRVSPTGEDEPARDEAAEDSLETGDVAVPPMVVADEDTRSDESASVESAPADAASSEDDAPPADATLAAIRAQPARCVSLGPFLNLREATEATAMLNEIGLQPNQRLAESQVWFGHWVHLPEQPTRAAAIAIVEDLREKGVSDIYIEPSGEYRNWISLGVFTDAAHAETRAGQIRRLGISPQIRDRYRDSSVYWVDFALPADRDIDPGAYQSSPSRVLRLEERDCPAAAG